MHGRYKYMTQLLIFHGIAEYSVTALFFDQRYMRVMFSKTRQHRATVRVTLVSTNVNSLNYYNNINS